MLCPNCETENRDGAKFCDECGFPLKQGNRPEPSRAETPEGARAQEPPFGFEPSPAASGQLEDAAEPGQLAGQPDPEQAGAAPSPEDQQVEQPTAVMAEIGSGSEGESESGGAPSPEDQLSEQPTGVMPGVGGEPSPDAQPAEQPAGAMLETEGAPDDLSKQGTRVIAADLAGFDLHVDDYGEGLVGPGYQAPKPDFRDGGTMQMPRIDSDEAPKSKDYLASSTKEKQGKGKLVAIAVVAIAVLVAIAAFASYQMQMWGGKVVPDVTGMTEADARSVLADQGFEVVTQQVKSDDTEGLVLIEDPSAGSRAEEGAQVVIHLATARTIPEIAGKTNDEAEKLLAEAGYENVKYEEQNSDKAKGTVLSVDPKEGSRAKSSAQVTVKTAKPYTVPDVAGKAIDEAIRAIEKAGLGYEAVDYDTNDYPEGTVVSSDPAAGTEVKKGYYVVLNVAQSRGTKLEELASSQFGSGSTIDKGGKTYSVESLDSVSYEGNNTVSYSATVREFVYAFGMPVSNPETETISGTIVFDDNDQVVSIS